MNFPESLKYTKTHEWVEILDDGTVVIGLTDYAQKELGDIVFVNLPEVDDSVSANEAFADVESVKAVSDVLSPADGVVSEVNEALLDAPETINENPYEAWFVKITDAVIEEELMDADAYKALVEELEA